MKKILIFGVTGQDGILLSEYLLKKKITVYGTTRKRKNKYLNKKVKLIYKNKLSLKFISSLIAKIHPHEKHLKVIFFT